MSARLDTLRALGDGGEATRVLAGDCTVIYDGDRREEHRGFVTVVVKPDNTVLVHDAAGYQPVAWLTRADAVSCARGTPRRSAGPGADSDGRGTSGGADPGSAGRPSGGSDAGPAPDDTGSAPSGINPEVGSRDGVGRHAGDERESTRRSTTGRSGAAFAVDAQDGDARLLVRAHSEDGYAAYPATRAGRPVGTCPDCSGTLVRVSGAVSCIGCGVEHGLPDGATVRDERCDCGLPRLRVERGAPLDVCLDRSCDPLLSAVRERFDREWSCPRCGSDLRILSRGGLIAGCETYPDCETGFAIPTGTVVDECDCGLPVFETARQRRCLDSNCDGR